tara:strand:+ start:220 stop:2244 length:2025 start_codon:yes stop_codon:yes gene_type:complete
LCGLFVYKNGGIILSNFKGSKTWRLVLLLSVFAMVAVACGGGSTADEVVEEAAPEVTAAPATTAAAAEPAAPSGPAGTYKMAIFSEPQTQNYWDFLDGENDVWTSYAMSSQATSLFSVSYPNYNLVANMASSLVEASTDNEDGTFTYVVGMKEGYTWSDGSAITANDMVFTYNTVKGLGLQQNWVSGYKITSVGDDGTESQGVVSIVANNDYEVAITFNYDPGLSDWQYGVAQVSILPESYWSQYATDRETLIDADGINAPVASAFVYEAVEPGAFTLWGYDSDTMYFGGETTIYASGTRIVNDNGVAPAVDESFGDTTGDSFTYSSGPFVGNVEFTLYGDQDAAYLAFQNGEVNFVLNPLGLKRNLYNELARNSDIELVSNFSNGYRYLAFNTRVFPGSNKHFRQAVSCMVDKDFVINNVLQGVALRMDGQMPAALTAWVAPTQGIQAECEGMSSAERYDKAVAVLQAGGWSATDWGLAPQSADDRATPPTDLKGPNGEVAPENMLLYAPGAGYDPLRATFSLYIADWMKQLGFDAIAQPTNFSVIVDKVFTPENCEEWYFYMLGWGLSAYPDHPVDFFASKYDTCDGGYNTPGFSNAEYDALADQFGAAKSVGEAVGIMNQMEAILYEEMPYLVLFTTPILEAYAGVAYPFTDVLAGLSNLGGLAGSVKLSD